LVKEVTEPHTGFIRTNEMGEALSCSYGYPVESTYYTLVFEEFTAESFDFGTASTISLDYLFYELSSNDECVSIIGNTNENNTNKPDLQIFPNPGKGPFRVLTEAINPGHLASLALYNVNGKLIYAKEAHWSELQLLDVDMESGIYFVRISAEDKVFTAKLVVR
ncbi:MAG: T9SS type A sorting domain-containing protein, partial [Bacteroidetes bacterium]|nr:T9SS type A sorting domain-containing protein [Bacteroidota bacterium]